mmetsp:Transcript_11256/g.47230  ORF Transcript_11256/g.47230 Transcript_11256/m.47230 type:complete len:277 (-) Transcript_11256:1753-2583(-)
MTPVRRRPGDARGPRHRILHGAAPVRQQSASRSGSLVHRVHHVIELRGALAHLARAVVPLAGDGRAPDLGDGVALAVHANLGAVADALAQLLESRLRKVHLQVSVDLRRVRDERPGQVLGLGARADVLLRALLEVARHERVLLPREHRGVPLDDVHVDVGVQVVVGVSRVRHGEPSRDDVRKVEREHRRAEVQRRCQFGNVHVRQSIVDQLHELFFVRVIEPNGVGQDSSVPVRRAFGQNVVVLQRVQTRLVQPRLIRALHLVNLEVRHGRELREP